MTLYNDVIEFHDFYDLPYPPKPTLLSKELLEFRIKFLKEELQEFIDANENQDLVEAADALVDLVYVALGTAAFMGLPYNTLWAHVHHANMVGKTRAKTDEESKRRSSYDVIKLPTFVAPNEKIRETLRILNADC